MSDLDQVIDSAQKSDELGTLLGKLVDEFARFDGEDTPEEAVQLLLTLATKRYVECRQAGRDLGPFVHDDALNATEVMVTVTNMLHAADIELFELAMWAVPGTNETVEGETA